MNWSISRVSNLSMAQWINASLWINGMSLVQDSDIFSVNSVFNSGNKLQTCDSCNSSRKGSGSMRNHYNWAPAVVPYNHPTTQTHTHTPYTIHLLDCMQKRCQYKTNPSFKGKSWKCVTVNPAGNHKNNLVVGRVHVRVCMLMVWPGLVGVRETIVCHALSTPAPSCLQLSVQPCWTWAWGWAGACSELGQSWPWAIVWRRGN